MASVSVTLSASSWPRWGGGIGVTSLAFATLDLVLVREGQGRLVLLLERGLSSSLRAEVALIFLPNRVSGIALVLLLVLLLERGGYAVLVLLLERGGTCSPPRAQLVLLLERVRRSSSSLNEEVRSSSCSSSLSVGVGLCLRSFSGAEVASVLLRGRASSSCS